MKGRRKNTLTETMKFCAQYFSSVRQKENIFGTKNGKLSRNINYPFDHTREIIGMRIAHLVLITIILLYCILVLNDMLSLIVISGCWSQIVRNRLAVPDKNFV